MDFVQQPDEEFERVVLLRALVLHPITLDDLLEDGGELGVVLARPECFQQDGQLLGDFALGAVLLRVELVAARQVDLVAVQDEVLGKDVRVRDALQDGVDEAGVTVVAQAGDAGRVVRAPSLQADGRHATFAVRQLDAADVLGDFIDKLTEGRPTEYLLAGAMDIISVAIVWTRQRRRTHIAGRLQCVSVVVLRRRRCLRLALGDTRERIPRQRECALKARDFSGRQLVGLRLRAVAIGGLHRERTLHVAHNIRIQADSNSFVRWRCGTLTRRTHNTYDLVRLGAIMHYCVARFTTECHCDVGHSTRLQHLDWPPMPTSAGE